MNEASTRARLSVFADLQTEPVLGEADIQVVLDMSKRSDINGIWPSDTGWEETYDVNYAIAQCWLIKASRLAPRYLFMSGGKMFSRNQFYEHCMQLYQKYLGKAHLSALRLADGGAHSHLDEIPNNWNPADVTYSV